MAAKNILITSSDFSNAQDASGASFRFCDGKLKIATTLGLSKVIERMAIYLCSASTAVFLVDPRTLTTSNRNISSLISGSISTSNASPVVCILPGVDKLYFQGSSNEIINMVVNYK